jgi:E3 ubiquitin-protein ligase TRIP12
MAEQEGASEQEDKDTVGQSREDHMSEDSADDNPYNEEEDDDDDDPFGAHYLGRPPGGLSGTLRALSGMMTGVSSRLRGILDNLRQKDDPTVQYIALQELSEILLVSTEDNLAGHFSPDAYVKELVTLMQPGDFGENPEMMLLACRCIANLMEALPASVANVVYGGAVPILCQKLLEIHFIDLAEQALSVCVLWPFPGSSLTVH